MEGDRDYDSANASSEEDRSSDRDYTHRRVSHKSHDRHSGYATKHRRDREGQGDRNAHRHSHHHGRQYGAKEAHKG